MATSAILILGVGQVGFTVAAHCADKRRVIGTTRQPQRLFDLFHAGIEPIVMPWPSVDVIEPLARHADVVITFPPDGNTDAILAPACLDARSIVYISSTGVYGKREGFIDDTTPVDEDDERAVQRLEAEKIWRSIGANVLRAPGIYGPTSGLHLQLQKDNYRVPGDGSRVSSRIHVDDLASLVLAMLISGKQGETYVVGDDMPASHLEVVNWLCRRLQLPVPESVPLDSVHYTQRSNRAVDGTRALRDLGVELKYPNYKEGYEACLQAAVD